MSEPENTLWPLGDKRAAVFFILSNPEGSMPYVATMGLDDLVEKIVEKATEAALQRLRAEAATGAGAGEAPSAESSA